MPWLADPEEDRPDDGYVPEEDMLKMIDGLMERQERRKAFDAGMTAAERRTN